MRLERVDLHRWGPFAQAASLPLDPDRPRLHLVHGPNEAGKSSTLRALNALLFGIARGKCRDAHRHARADLRLGAVIRSEEGEQLAFVRLSKEKAALVTPDGQGLIDETRLRSFLEGVDRQQYELLYALSHASMREGADQLLGMEGVSASVLAASGWRDLRERARVLEQRAQELYKAGGSRPPLNAIGKQIRDLRTARRDHGRDSEALEDLRERHAAALEAFEASRDELSVRRQRLEADEALAGARVPLKALAKQRAACDALGVVPELPKDAESLFHAANRQSAHAQSLVTDGQRRLEEARERLEKVAENRLPAVLVARREIEALADEADRVRTAQDRLIELRAVEKEQERAIGRLTSHLGIDPASLPVATTRTIESDAEALVVAANEADTKRRGLAEELEHARAELAQARNDATEQDRQEVASSARTALESALQRAQRAGDRQADQATHRRAVDEAARRASGALAAMRPEWQREGQEVLDAAWPPREHTNAFTERWRQAVAMRDGAVEDVRRGAHELEEAEIALHRAREKEGLVAPETVRRARRLRDAAWRHLRRDLESAPPTIPDAEALDAIEERGARADEEADALARGADALATLAARKEAHQTASQRLSEARAKARAAEDRLGSLLADERESWPQLQRWPDTPDRLTELRDLAGQFVEAEADRERGLEALGTLERQEADAAASLRSTLSLLGISAPDQGDLEQLVAIGRHWIAEEERERSVRQARTTIVEERRQQIERLEQQEQALNRAQSAIEDRARTLAERLGEEGVPPAPHLRDLAVSLRDAAERGEAIEKARGEREQVEQIIANHEQAITRLSASVFAEAAANDRPTSLATLVDALGTAREREAAWSEGQEAVRSIEDEIQREERDLVTARSERQQLLDAAGAEDDAEFLTVLRRIEERRQREESVREAAHSLEEAWPEGDESELIDRIEAAGDRLEESQRLRERDALQRLEEEVEDLRLTERELSQQVATRQAKLGDGAELAQRLATSEAEAGDLLREVLSLRLAEELAGEVLARRSASDERPVLAHAKRLFLEMTHGRYVDLHLTWSRDGKRDELRLEARGENGVPGPHRAIGDLSDGTRDQLFLALRLGHILHRADQGQVFPIVLDDILVHTDERRAIPLLGCLAEVSRRCQVLLFTHQKRVVELARQNVPGDQLVVHELEELGAPPIEAEAGS